VVDGEAENNSATLSNAILVVVNRLTKRRHFIARHNTCAAADLAEIFLIISDRGHQFATEFWEALCARLVIEPLLSEAYHPEMDGQTKRNNASMQQ
jgi:hypothetical protein